MRHADPDDRVETVVSDRTSGTPIRGCPAGTLDAFSANGKCSGNGTRDCTRPTQPYTRRSSPTPESGSNETGYGNQRQKRWYSIRDDRYSREERQTMESLDSRPPIQGGRSDELPYLIGLALDAEVHDVIATDGAIVHHDVPGPQGDRVPLLHLEALLLLFPRTPAATPGRHVHTSVVNVHRILSG